MDIENHSNSAFSPISPSFAVQTFKEPIIVEGCFAENSNSLPSIILTLTKKHIIARSNSLQHSEKIFFTEINFDLKFEVLYMQEVHFD